jgi:hypothetical protein
MTRNRRRKLDTRTAATDSGIRYAQARGQALEAPGAGIRTYRGVISICSACGQPAYDSVTGASPARPVAARIRRPGVPKPDARAPGRPHGRGDHVGRRG